MFMNGVVNFLNDLINSPNEQMPSYTFEAWLVYNMHAYVIHIFIYILHHGYRPMKKKLKFTLSMLTSNIKIIYIFISLSIGKLKWLRLPAGAR